MGQVPLHGHGRLLLEPTLRAASVPGRGVGATASATAVGGRPGTVGDAGGAAAPPCGASPMGGRVSSGGSTPRARMARRAHLTGV